MLGIQVFGFITNKIKSLFAAKGAKGAKKTQTILFYFAPFAFFAAKKIVLIGGAFQLMIPQFSIILSCGIWMKETMTDEILTLKEVANYLKLADKTAYRLAAEGKLPGFKVGGSWRFKMEEIEIWIKKQHNQPGRG